MAAGRYSVGIALPPSVDLTAEFPAVGNQESLGSCVAFAVAYAEKTQQEAQEWEWDLGSSAHIFSPSYMYSQIHATDDPTGGGTWFSAAFNLMVEQGCTTLEDMPYNGQPYGWQTQPTSDQRANAALFKALSWAQLPSGNCNEIRAQIAAGNPVVIGIPVFPDFDGLSPSNPIYDDASGSSRGGHAICIVGYDDGMQAFKFINSWGPYWGLSGYGWIAYSFITGQYIEAYEMTDIVVSKASTYLLKTDGSLWRVEDSSQTLELVDTGVKSFQAISDSLIYVLSNDGNLWREHGNKGNRELVDFTAKGFQAIDASVVYVLGYDNNLWRERGNKDNRDLVDFTVTDFQAIDASLVYVLGYDNNLWRERGNKDNRDLVDFTVTAFHALNASVVYVQGYDNNLWRERGNKDDRDLVDSTVTAFKPVDASLAYVRVSNGVLWRERGNRNDRDLVDPAATAFQPIDMSLVYVLTSDGNLWREQGSFQNRVLVGSSVRAFQAFGN